MSSNTEMPVASEVKNQLQAVEKKVVELGELMEMFKAIEVQLGELKKATKLAVKAKSAAGGAAPKAERKKREGSFPKGETPKQVTPWMETVQATLAEMKEKGWTAHMKKEKGSMVDVAASENREGVYVFPGTGKEPTYKDAMSYASFRRGSNSSGTSASVSGATTPAAPADKVAKALAKEEAKAAKLAEKEAAKAVKLAEKEATKLAKLAEKEATKLAKLAEKEAAKAAKLAEKEVKLAEKTTAKKGAAPVPAVAASASAEEEGEVRQWVFRGKTYYRTGANECWMQNADGSMGKWAGVYDPVADKIDDSCPEPEVDFE